MSKIFQIDLGAPTILEFKGPDAVRYLNGQLTQDVRLVFDSHRSLPSCVTDSKGKLQFRVNLSMGEDDGALWVSGLAEWAEALEARLTRYLIADDVEVTHRTGEFSLSHITGPLTSVSGVGLLRVATRFGVSGTDVWTATGQSLELPNTIQKLAGDALETFRIAQGIAVWGSELTEGILPPEARLDVSDISYHKGCYIGQEVISRIKSAGKVNKQLAQFSMASAAAVCCGPLVNAEGMVSGELTSISPDCSGAVRLALGYAKRGATEFIHLTAAGTPVVLQRIL